MKNLKKVLALALAIALSLTMFAGAAFTDQEEINKTEAVDTLVALGVINGMPDGSFNPDGNVTRAEMAKMIYAVRMRGNTDAGNFAGLSTSFTDLYDDWYKGYVKWAQSAGIIAGKSATTFDPNGSVTGTEAAKMLLVLAGYTSDKAGLTGVNWETNTIKYASQAGLLDNMDNVDLSKALPRQYAAQLIYNALFTPMVKWSNDSETFEELTSKDQSGDNSTTVVTTIGLQYMDLRIYDGIFWGNYLTGDAAKEGYISVGQAVVEYDLDLDWIGEEVSVLYQDNNLKGTTGTLDNDDAIYGVTKTGNTTVYNITKADLKNTTDGNDKIKFDGVNHNVITVDGNTGLYVYVNYQPVNGGALVDAEEFDISDADAAGDYYGKSADTIKFVADETGEIYAAYIIEKTVSKIVSVTSDKVNIRGEGVLDIEGEDLTVSLYDGAAADDYIYYAEMYVNDPVLVVEKAETIEDGKVTSIKGNEITIDGTAYAKSVATNNTGMAITTGAGINAGDIYDVVLYGSHWVAAELVDETADDYALVLGSEDSDIYGLTVKLLKADNTTAVYTVDEDYENVLTGTAADQGVLVGYSEQDDGTIKLYATTAIDTEDTTAITYTKANKSLSYTVDGDGAATTKLTSSGAVAFLKDGDDDWGAYAVDTLAKQTVAAASNDPGQTIYTATNTSGNLLAFAIDLGADVEGAGGDDLYGYIVDSISVEEDYRTIPVWNGTETVAVRVDTNDDPALTLAQGDFVKIPDFNAEKTYTVAAANAWEIAANDDIGDAIDTMTTPAAITLYTKLDSVDSRSLIVITNGVFDGNKLVDPDNAENEVKKASLPLAEDYKVIGVNVADQEAYEGAVLQKFTEDTYKTADEVADGPAGTALGDGKDYNNVMVITNDDGEVIVIFIDVDNCIQNPGAGNYDKP